MAVHDVLFSLLTKHDERFEEPVDLRSSPSIDSTGKNEEEEQEVSTTNELMNPYELSSTVAAVCACILDECVNSLNIIGKIGTLPVVQENLNYRTLEEKYDNDECASYIFDPRTMIPFAEALANERLVKFQKDRSYVEQVLQECIEELLVSNSYGLFTQRIIEYKKSFQEEHHLLEKAKECEIEMNTLKKNLEQEKVDYLMKIQKTSEEIAVTKDHYENLIFENAVKEHYIDKWEDSRFEMNNVELDQKEEYYTNIINEYKNEIEKENRINAEIELYITQNQQEYEDQIQEWMEAYDREVEIRDMEITILKERREEQFLALEALTKLYEKHKREIEEFLAIKEERRRAQEYEELLNRMATKIQAWWRGVMVRRHLGPFRKKGKKGGSKGGKKK